MRIELYDGDRLIAIANFFDIEHQHIDTIAFYDPDGRLTTTQLYDWAGWLSMTQIHDTSGRVTTQLFWNQERELVYQEQYGEGPDGEWGNLQMLLNYGGMTRSFDSLEALFAYFLDFIVTDDDAAVLIADRNETTVVALTMMVNPARKVLYMHGSHVLVPNDPDSNLTYWVRRAAEADFDAIITPTDHQAADLRRRVTVPVYTVPVRYLTKDEMMPQKIMFRTRPRHTVLAIVGLFKEEGLADLIEAIALVKRKVRDAKLNIFSAMVGDEVLAELDELIAARRLKKVVSIRESPHDLDQLYAEGQVMAVTSVAEGFNVTILDALSYGMPIITYDIDYGPTELVVDDVNGRIVRENTPEAMAAVLIELFKHEDQLMELSTGAYESVLRYSEAAVWAKWEKALDSVRSDQSRGGDSATH